MSGRRLTPDEAELWRRVKSSVRPIGKARHVLPAVDEALAAAMRVDAQVRTAARGGPAPAAVRKSLPLRPAAPTNTLDGGWDKRLMRGAVAPDRTIDLHGHSLASAHAALDREIAAAVAQGDRVLLLVTGKPPRPESERPHARGAIRAAIGDWLAGSRHSDRIAAVRGAHPRHGGTGALYLILRRPR